MKKDQKEEKMIKLLKRLKPKQWLYIMFSIALIVLQVYLDLKLPDYMASITTIVQTEGSLVKDVLGEGVKMLGCAFGSLLSAVVVSYFVTKVAATFSRDLRKDIFGKVLSFSMEEIKNFSTSSLITRTTNDITQVQMLIAMGMQMLIKAPIMAVWAIMKIYGKGFEWSVITAGAVGILLIMILILILVALPKFKIIQKLTDNLNHTSRENLTGIRVVRAFNAEKYQEGKFANANNELTKTNMFTSRTMALLTPGMQLIMSGLSLSIYWVGAYMINDAGMLDKLTIFSNMVVFSSYAMQVVMSFMMLTMIFIFYPRAQVSAKRILEILEKTPKIVSGVFSGKTKETGTIEFKDVTFRYPDAEENMLENISFKVEKGETVAFIGSTGSGKSTLVNLIPRFYDATYGEVLVDGVNVKNYKLEELNNRLGYVSQKPIIFSGTVASNISYGLIKGKKVSKSKIEEASKVAQASEFIEKMEDKYNSSISRSGTNISGGQKQRLSIARAIARDPEIYIFDDTFSALDYKTDTTLRKELKNHTKDATTLIVAQRIGTIKNADKIIVLNEGKIVGQGTHKELLKTCDVYKEIALSQLSKEELENA